MLSSVFPFIYAIVLIVLLWHALKIMFRGYSAANAFDRSQKSTTKDRTGQFTIHPELLDKEGNITEEDLLTVRFSNDLDHPKQTESSSE